MAKVWLTAWLPGPTNTPALRKDENMVINGKVWQHKVVNNCLSHPGGENETYMYSSEPIRSMKKPVNRKTIFGDWLLKNDWEKRLSPHFKCPRNQICGNYLHNHPSRPLRTSVSSRLFYTWPPRTSNCGPALWASPAAHMHHQNWKQNTSALHVHAMTTVSLIIIILSMTLWHKQTTQLHVCAHDYMYVLTLSIAKELIQLLRSNLLAAIPRVAWLILCYPLFL